MRSLFYRGRHAESSPVIYWIACVGCGVLCLVARIATWLQARRELRSYVDDGEFDTLASTGYDPAHFRDWRCQE